jgi:hypothetical protein
LAGGDILTKVEAIENDKAATRVLRHIAKFWETHPHLVDVPIVFVPESNMKHSAAGIPGFICDEMWTESRNLHYAKHLQILHRRNADGTPVIIPGINTGPDTKTVGIVRLASRFANGPASISRSPYFFTTTLKAGSTTELVSPKFILERLHHDLSNFQVIPPNPDLRQKVTRYSGKEVGAKDDFVMAMSVADLGYSEYISQMQLDVGR